MTLEELYKKLKETGLPVVYNSWEVGQAPPLPYLVYLEDGNDDLFADNTNYKAVREMTVELYTAKKAPETESIIEKCLNSLGLTYRKYSAFIDSEKMQETAYEFNMI